MSWKCSSSIFPRFLGDQGRPAFWPGTATPACIWCPPWRAPRCPAPAWRRYPARDRPPLPRGSARRTRCPPAVRAAVEPGLVGKDLHYPRAHLHVLSALASASTAVRVGGVAVVILRRDGAHRAEPASTCRRRERRRAVDAGDAREGGMRTPRERRRPRRAEERRRARTVGASPSGRRARAEMRTRPPTLEHDRDSREAAMVVIIARQACGRASDPIRTRHAISSGWQAGQWAAGQLAGWAQTHQLLNSNQLDTLQQNNLCNQIRLFRGVPGCLSVSGLPGSVPGHIVVRPRVA